MAKRLLMRQVNMNRSLRTWRALRPALAGLLSLGIAAPVLGWDGAVSGKPVAFEITHGSNFAFRVFLDAGSSMCSGGPTWAYLNEADSNYKVYVANFMAAKLQGNRVTVYSTLENGYCHIGHLAVVN